MGETFLKRAEHRHEVRTEVSVRRGLEATGSSRLSHHGEWGPPGPPYLTVLRQDSEVLPGLASPHFLLARFSLFSPPFELLKGDLSFQVVDELRAKPRHVCGVLTSSPSNGQRRRCTKCGASQSLSGAGAPRAGIRCSHGKPARTAPQLQRQGSAGASGPASFQGARRCGRGLRGPGESLLPRLRPPV